MAYKPFTRCELCGSKDVEADERGQRCKSCGATMNRLPETKGLPFKGEGYKDSLSMTRSKLK